MKIFPYSLFLIFFIAAPTLLNAEKKEGAAGVTVAKVQTDEVMFPNTMYGTLELRHHLNTYYDKEDYRASQQPEVHVRGRVGAMFRQGLIDAYATVGGIKRPATRQLVQRRPEFEIDIYPIFGKYGQIVQYNLVQFPFSEKEYGRSDEPAAADEITPQKEGSVYVVGIAPTAVYPIEINGAKMKIKSGLDLWTEFFSRRQYRERSTREGDHYAAVEDESGAESAEAEPAEETAPYYYTQFMFGGSISPAWLRAFTTGISVYYDVNHYPRYEDTPTETNYTYGTERSSHYRIRLAYEIGERTTVTNDFYHFHDGFFEKKRYGDERRYRNIAKIAYDL